MPFRHRNGILNLIFNFPDCSGMTGNISYAEFSKDVGPPDKSGENLHGPMNAVSPRDQMSDNS